MFFILANQPTNLRFYSALRSLLLSKAQLNFPYLFGSLPAAPQELSKHTSSHTVIHCFCLLFSHENTGILCSVRVHSIRETTSSFQPPPWPVKSNSQQPTFASEQMLWAAHLVLRPTPSLRFFQPMSKLAFEPPLRLCRRHILVSATKPIVVCVIITGKRRYVY
jgi:hypothetical protein